MNNEYWLKRWRDGEIGFHREVVNGHLRSHGRELLGPAGNRVLVPMCGKSLDLLWLEEQGYQVVGLELSELAVRGFMEEHGRRYDETAVGDMRVFESGAITVMQGDLFSLPAGTPVPVQGIYDRAAFHALESPPRRERYALLLRRLLVPKGGILMLTLTFDQEQMEGPPYSVDEDELRRVFEPDFEVTRLQREEIIGSEPRLRERGLSSCFESVHWLHRG